MTSQRLRVLVIAHHLPYPPETGGRIRLYNVYRRLADRYDITWVCPLAEADRKNLEATRSFCRQVIELPAAVPIALPERGIANLWMRAIAHLHWERLFEYFFGYVRLPGLSWMPATPERRALVHDLVTTSRWDLIICETICAVELAPRVSNTPVLVSLFDIQSELFRRLRRVSPWTWEDALFFLPELLKIWAYEARHYRRFDAAITVSEHDKSLLQRLCPGLRTAVIDNGVDCSYYRPAPGTQMENSLVFVGSYGYPPNRDAAWYFAEQVLPRIRAVVEDATFLVVGRDAPLELGQFPGVRVIGAVLDVRPYLQQASVVVVPLRAGSGTRLKILEAMAMGKPVVTTSLGREGLRSEHGRHIIVADKPVDFAGAVLRLLADPSLRQEIGANARRLVEQQYDWSRLAQQHEALIMATARDFVCQQTGLDPGVADV